jgi:uncharacterized C2H2 Zn-finger protein
MINAHGDMYFKCTSCPMAFKSMASFNGHKPSHKEGSIVAHKTIYKCPCCDTVFQQVQGLRTHVQSHMKDTMEAPSYSFMCLECHLVFDTKSTLQVHSAERHRDKHFQEICDLCGFKSKSTYEALLKHTCKSSSKGVFTSIHETSKLDIGVISRCTICGKIYSNNSPKFQQHMKDHKMKGEMDNDEVQGKASSSAENTGKSLVVKDKTKVNMEKLARKDEKSSPRATNWTKKRSLEGTSKQEPARKKLVRDNEEESDSSASSMSGSTDDKTSKNDSDVTGVSFVSSPVTCVV